MAVDLCSARCLSAAAVDDVLMTKVAAYVAENYHCKIRVVDIALCVNVSVRTLQNLFHRHCGEPPLSAIRRFRLRKLHVAIQQKPWSPLRLHLERCGLTGSIADRDLFLAMYGLTIRELQHSCRRRRTDVVVPLVPREGRAELEHFLLPSA